jgi:neurotransmitter:Na+ symporter, NSS family
MSEFLAGFQGRHSRWGVSGLAYLGFVLTMAFNIWILSGGIRRGIERAASWGMPVLILLSVRLAIRVLTLGAPDPSHPEHHVWNGMGLLGNPDFTRLTDAKVWLAAAGQIFFTLSVGFGTLQVYASYLRSRDDVVVTGLSTTMVNQWGEGILGGTMAIPIAYAFFGPQGTVDVAHGGAFNLGFATRPVVLPQLPWHVAFGTAWFFLLLIAGTLSQLALMQPLITFLQDDLGWSHRKAVLVTSGVIFLAAHVPTLGLTSGALEEIACWAGTFGGTLFAFVETSLCLALPAGAHLGSNPPRGAGPDTPVFPGGPHVCHASLLVGVVRGVGHALQSRRVYHGGRAARRYTLEMGG